MRVLEQSALEVTHRMMKHPPSLCGVEQKSLRAICKLWATNQCLLLSAFRFCGCYAAILWQQANQCLPSPDIIFSNTYQTFNLCAFGHWFLLIGGKFYHQWNDCDFLEKEIGISLFKTAQVNHAFCLSWLSVYFKALLIIFSAAVV